MPFSEQFRVRAYEAGPDGRVTVQTVCNYLQEVAGNHARELGLATDQLIGQGLAWVLGRLQVRVDRYPFWWQEIGVETWPSAVDGMTAQRDFLLTDDSGRPVGAATSTWLIIDLEKRRAIRMPDFVHALPRPEREPALEHRPPQPLAPAEAEVERRFTVRMSDLDMNRHVNNVRFIEWALEAVPEDVRAGRALRWFDVLFRAESNYGDEVVSACGRLPDGRLAHRVSRASDDRELALLTTEWA
jgi:medium-chain acyl-[acyl-carrier-protein] hydrolase